MGELALSGGDGGGGAEEMEVIEQEQGRNGETESSVALKMVLRVLLVEADDSTRQIISALLRKCSYRVSAVADGLKAWEVLRERPENVDLILTEVELPSISGYALLTLIMEHEVCKNIPVIMMSSHDSISMVYKCMLKGAADFLVKPVRKNELRNLWQHVWRRQSVSRNDNLNAPVSPLPNGDCSEKGSDDQNSCVKLETDTEGENKERVKESLQRICVASLQTNLDNKVRDVDTALMKSPKRTIDMIGEFDNHSKQDNIGSGSKVANKIEPSQWYGSLNQFSDQKNILNHSCASAFTRYVNKTVQPNTGPTTNSNMFDAGNSDILNPIAVRGVGFSLGNAHSSMMSPMQSGGSSAGCEDPHFQTHPFHSLNHNAPSYEQSCRVVDRSTDTDTTQAENRQGHIDNHQMSQREAALTKFRLKRKDRCFEKKVRYESRKKLAEQRPRVKGQFVRQQPG